MKRSSNERPDVLPTPELLSNEEIIVACVWTSGPRFTPEYVFRLAEGVRRFLRPPFRFLVVRPEDPTYWGKLELFKPGLFPAGARVLYLDLDTVPVGSLEFVRELDLQDGELYMVPPLSGGHGQWNSSVLLFRAGTLGYLRTGFRGTDKDTYPGGDQHYLRARVQRTGLRQFPTAYCPSYKKEVLPAGKVPSEARIIVFHGSPMPHEVNWGRL